MSEINRFEGYRAVQEKPILPLPVGGYVARIEAVKQSRDKNENPRIAFRVEIIEGPYEGYYHKDYEARRGGMYEAKYRGAYCIPIPDNSRTEQNLRSIDRFNHTMGAIEGSNPGYTWNWNLSSLKGLKIGLSVRECEYRGTVYTEIGKFIPLSTIRDHRFRPMGRRVAQDDNSTHADTAAIPGTDMNMAARRVTSGNTPGDTTPVPASAPPQYGPDAKVSSDADIPF